MASNSSDEPELRSSRWFDPDSLRGFGHRSRLKGMGYDDEDYRGKPVVAILNTWSDLNTCHSHFPERVQEVKRGIWQMGGFPVEIPVMSLGEMMMKPTTMLYRNLLAMETEEVLRCHPIDAAVLMGGCDKTVPAMIMGAISANLPAIFLPAGPMLKARWKDQTLGSGSDAWKYWDERRAGNLCDEAWGEIENCIARSAGTCMTMGTASTMAAIAEAMGLTLPGASSVPAVISEHSRLAVATGRRAVQLAQENLRPSDLLTPESFDNAIVTSMAIGGSTNAIVHIIAMARRAGFDLTLERFDELSRTTPVLANVRPAGKFLMEDFFDAGGLTALLKQLGEHIQGSCGTVNGLTLADNIANGEVIDPDIIRSTEDPISLTGGTFVLRGNLAPSGCIIKPTAASPRLLEHTGPAVVFDTYAELKAKLNDPDTGITADSVLILRNAGPQGGPGFPEWGMLPIPDHLLKQGIRDLVRISDARMSGTSYGTCVLHVAPEAAVGGPLALVRNGDLIQLSIDQRRLDLLVDDKELAERRQKWSHPKPKYDRGYGAMFLKHVTQADAGCDFDFLHCSEETPDPEIY
ncbi:L-arabinonate dehydratase [Bremerella alba]|uniref:6-deoxy-6-sulfo-D-gluconate dehydratase n=1 Tax=Bremerella alba TaxID=980252 RepID=A0A7V8VA36_9BACT|nr:L-arabinonate dehydratase [Bremerella alba]MBA2117386.1 6-deoxy-6-sulfo-D-gluconate dehydratase [Bremerella alba]